MSLKRWVMFGMIAGSILGGYVPTLWGDSTFSVTSIMTSSLGGLIGIWAGYKLNQRF